MLSVILAAAVATAQPAPPAVSDMPKDPDPKVCHTEPIQGSRITHKVCLRASEAAQLKRDARWLLLDRAQAASQAPNMATIVSMGPMH